LDLNVINFLQFLTKNCHKQDLKVSYENKEIASIHTITFLGTSVDRSLSWKNHTDQLINKLNNKSCYAIKSIKPLLFLQAIRMVYFSYVHSRQTYGIIFRANSSYAKSLFKIQKRIIRIMTTLEAEIFIVICLNY
jgi:hypothetical protein